MPQRIRTEDDLRVLLIRARTVPILSTMAGSMLTLVPVVTSWPALPPFGYLMLLGWRLLRPEIWPAWVGLLLGLFNDLISGQAIGSAACLWTITLLAIDLLDAQLVWRDYWIDWLIGAVALIVYIAGSFWLDGLDREHVSLLVVAPQMILSIFCFPIVVRLCVRMDRWRLPT